MKQSSITDWIQTLAVVLGISFALWEFVLHDRAQIRSQRAAVLSLILESKSTHSAAGTITKKFGSLTDDQIEHMEAVEFSVMLMPFESHFSAWSFCYRSELCDKGLTLEFMCQDLQGFDKMRNHVMEKLGGKIVNDPNYTYLLNECRGYKGI